MRESYGRATPFTYRVAVPVGVTTPYVMVPGVIAPSVIAPSVIAPGVTVSTMEPGTTCGLLLDDVSATFLRAFRRANHQHVMDGKPYAFHLIWQAFRSASALMATASTKYSQSTLVLAIQLMVVLLQFYFGYCFRALFICSKGRQLTNWSAAILCPSMHKEIDKNYQAGKEYDDQLDHDTNSGEHRTSVLGE